MADSQMLLICVETGEKQLFLAIENFLNIIYSISPIIYFSPKLNFHIGKES